MGEPREHDAKGKETDTEDHLLYDSTGMKCPGPEIHRQEVDLWRLRAGGLGGGRLGNDKGVGFLSEMTKMF